MAFRVRPVSAALLLSGAAITSGLLAQTTIGKAPILKPGAPGQSSKALSPEAAAVPRRLPTEADTSFMQGMIMHHSQAVEMTDLLRTRTRNPELQELGKRISISQTDEMN